MNIQAILVADLFGSVLLIILMVSRYMTRRHRRIDDHIFAAVTILAIFGGIIEIISFAVDGHPGTANHIWNILTNTYLYMANVAIATLWVLYVDVRLYRSREQVKGICVQRKRLREGRPGLLKSVEREAGTC